MKDLKITDYIVGWVIFFVSSTAAGAIIGAIVGGIAGLIIGSAGGSMTTIKIVAGALGFICAIPFSFLLYFWTVKQFVLPKAQNFAAESPMTGQSQAPN